MNKITSRVLFIMGAVILAGAGAAMAQPAPPSKNIFVDVNFGLQPSARTFSVEAFPVVYGEFAVIHANQGVDGSGILDVMAGYRVWRDFSAALGLTTTLGGGGAASVTGGIPHPLFFDRRVETTQTLEVSHSERSAHLSVMWTSPVTDKIDASVMAGPSYIKVVQDVVSTVTVPPGTQNFTPVMDEQTATAFGFHVGGEITYLIRPRLGVGGLVRFVKAKADLPAVPDLGIAGLQIGGGLRIRF